jgi:hypothetical protein
VIHRVGVARRGDLVLDQGQRALGARGAGRAPVASVIDLAHFFAPAGRAPLEIALIFPN